MARVGARTTHSRQKMAVLGNDAKWDEIKLFGKVWECERVAVEVGIQGDVVGLRRSVVRVEV